MRRALLALVLLVASGLARLAPADEGPRADISLASRLRDHLSPREFATLVRDALPGRPEDLVAAAGRLAEIGGPQVLASLTLLVGHGDPSVRLEALHATAAVRWRGEAIRQAVVSLLAGQPSPAERLAGLTALGWVGDGRDIPYLLDAADAPDPDVAAAAQQAFRNMTGLRAPARSGARRRAWWREISEHRSADVAAAWTTLGERPEASEAWWAIGLLSQLGWLDVPTANVELLGWLRSADPHRRRVAIDLARGLRLGDLGEDLRSASRHQAGEPAQAGG